MTAPALETSALTKRLPSGGKLLTILDDVTLAIPRGEFVAILGPSGSGKSTLLALLAGLDRPTSGTIRLDGEEIQALSEDALALLRRRNVGFVFQSFQLLSNLTARENILLPLELVDAPNARQRADELLSLVGLADRGHHYPSQLSGGEQQRVALARALANAPPIVLADEPTGNLDTTTGHHILELLRAIHRDRGTTIILVTHDAELAAIADTRLVLRDGRVVEHVMKGEPT